MNLLFLLLSLMSPTPETIDAVVVVHRDTMTQLYVIDEGYIRVYYRPAFKDKRRIWYRTSRAYQYHIVTVTNHHGTLETFTSDSFYEIRTNNNDWLEYFQ